MPIFYTHFHHLIFCYFQTQSLLWIHTCADTPTARQLVARIECITVLHCKHNINFMNSQAEFKCISPNEYISCVTILIHFSGIYHLVAYTSNFIFDKQTLLLLDTLCWIKRKITITEWINIQNFLQSGFFEFLIHFYVDFLLNMFVAHDVHIHHIWSMWLFFWFFLFHLSPFLPFLCLKISFPHFHYYWHIFSCF